MTFEETLARYKVRLEEYMNTLPFEGSPAILTDAMKYSLLGGGKRLRGCMVLAACEMLNGDPEQALPFAAALEMIHAYSLIHDDLPAMDNDTLRRGKPTNHMVYGDGMALLAGDGLLSYAFEWMARQEHPNALRALREVACYAGIGGMVAGQALDISLEGTCPSLETVEKIQLGKTSALLTAAVTCGMALAGANKGQTALGRIYGRYLGLAFQITDDLLDIQGDPGILGKSVGKDADSKKLTWPACRGIENARQDARKFADEAAFAVSAFGEKAFFFQELARFTVNRVN